MHDHHDDDAAHGTDHGQRAQWATIRDTALDGPMLYAPAPGVVHACATVHELARVTRHERRLCGARWPEDG